jgi:two-component system response regulator CpxR
VVTIDDQDFTLTVSEARLLEALLGQPGEPLEKQELAQLALGRKLTLYDRSLDMHVSNLRKKIGPSRRWPTADRGVAQPWVLLRGVSCDWLP